MVKILSKVAALSISVIFFSQTNGQVILLGNQLQPSNVSNTGAVVGSYQNSNFLWTVETGLKNIGDISNNSSYSGDADISADGKKAAFTSTNPATNLNEFTLYNVDTQTPTYLGGGSTSFEGTTGSAFTMSSDGKYIAGRTYGGTPIVSIPILWKEGNGFSTLQVTSQMGAGANGISADGTVIGGFQYSEFGEMMGVVWKNGIPNMILDANGIPMTLVTKISDNGSWAIGNCYDQSAFIWNETSGVTKIPPVNVATDVFTGYATGINSDGTRVVGYYRNAGNPSFDTNESFFWTPSTGSVLLSQYITSLGMDTQGIDFILPTDISPNGKYITGWGKKNGTLVGFRIELPQATMGVETIDKKQFSIYPNPAKNVLYVSGARLISDLEIFDLSGRKITELNEIKGSQIDISFLNKGVYLLKGIFDHKIQTIKIIKE